MSLIVSLVERGLTAAAHAVVPSGEGEGGGTTHARVAVAMLGLRECAVCGDIGTPERSIGSWERSE